MSILTWLKIGGVVAILAVLALHFRGDAKTRAERDEYRASAVDWKKNAEGWKASYEKQKQLRSDEQSRAQAAVNDANKSCDARVAEARRTTRAIKEIVYVEPKRDPAGCPVRGLVDPDQLRDALGAGTR